MHQSNNPISFLLLLLLLGIVVIYVNDISTDCVVVFCENTLFVIDVALSGNEFILFKVIEYKKGWVIQL